MLTSDSYDTATETSQLDATLQSIDEIANADVEMQGPLAEQLTIIVLDTNILLEFLDIVQMFVSEVEQQQLPVLLIIPGAVIYELDGQKNRNGLSWFARRASTWLLKRVKEKRSVKGQALDETCKPSGNWKKREPGTEFGTERTNDSLILDCCQYFFRVRQRRTFLCSKDKILAVEAESIGIPSIFPERESFCSRGIAQAVFGCEASKFRFSGYYPVYRSDSVEVAGPEAQKFGTPEAMSRHAPSYMRKHLMFWTASDSLEFLNMTKRCPNSNPKVDVFLTRPYQGRGARRGQDWSRRDWEVALGALTAVGKMWEEGSMIRESVPAVEFHMRRIFAMPMRPTGL
ncbi:hypothetical protein BS17DRAFT_794064 [Gyrodon lividus]|nr:hypothetical protein BS17DRAFT_794064 [Gyrodon lividus]